MRAYILLKRIYLKINFDFNSNALDSSNFFSNKFTPWSLFKALSTFITGC
jgi:hypothetical protein